MPGQLYLCATPIGNLGDASPRLIETLQSVDVVYAEDTRRSGRLMTALGVSVPLRSFFVGNERQRASELARDLESGKRVGLITDAGMPGVSDPGATAVDVARDCGAEVIVIPGPSAVTAAVAGSGLVDGPFVFVGFLERKGSRRGAELAAMAVDQRPTVLFSSPHRLGADLADLEQACGADRSICVGREITKVHEEFWWGTVSEAVQRWTVEKPRGEFTLVVSGGLPPEPDLAGAVRQAQQLVEEGMSPSQAARTAAAQTGVGRRVIYEQLLSR